MKLLMWTRSLYLDHVGNSCTHISCLRLLLQEYMFTVVVVTVVCVTVVVAARRSDAH